MNIAIETSALEGAQQYRGVGSYTKLLVEALLRYEPSHTYVYFQRGDGIPQADIIHYPFFDPFFLTLPLRNIKPVVVTVHDLIPIVFPNKFPRGLRGEIKWQIQKLSLSNCHRIITDSCAAKADIQRVTGISADKIRVIYLAPSSIFRRVVDSQVLRDVQKKYTLPNNYILYVGDVNWNKNIIGLLEAFDMIRRSQSEIRLVLAGKSFLDESVSETIQINATVKKLGLEKLVLKVGFVEEGDLPALYSLASLYIQPSFSEGFGLPVLEAMACGCRVVTSSASSLAEIAGPAIVCDPYNKESIVKSIHKALKLSNVDWKEKAEAWVSRYSWKKVANETMSVYKTSLS